MANYRSTTAWKFDERQQYTRGQTSREGRLAPNGTDLRRDRDYPRAITRDNGGVGEITTDTMGQMTEKYESPVNSSRSIDQPRRPRPETDQGGPRTLCTSPIVSPLSVCTVVFSRGNSRNRVLMEERRLTNSFIKSV